MAKMFLSEQFWFGLVDCRSLAMGVGLRRTEFSSPGIRHLSKTVCFPKIWNTAREQGGQHCSETIFLGVFMPEHFFLRSCERCKTMPFFSFFFFPFRLCAAKAYMSDAFVCLNKFLSEKK